MEIKYAPFEVHVETAFWHQLAKKKIDDLKLDDTELPITLDHGHGRVKDKCEVFVDHDALDNNSDNTRCGTLKNVNTVEEFKTSSKQGLLNDFGDSLFSDLDKIEKNPSSLLNCLLYTFVDLKSWNFHYWFAFPSPASKYFKHTLIQDTKPPPAIETPKSSFFAVQNDKTLELSELNSNPDTKLNPETTIFGFIDSSTHNSAVSWAARNFIYFIHKKYKISSFQVLAHRETGSKLINVKIDVEVESGNEVRVMKSDIETRDINYTGWCINHKGKLGSRQINLSSLMKPEKLAAQATDLNLKLMKWRIAPDLDLETIKSQRVLLLGAGTLGSNVARCLLGWGVKHISFVDCGKVSYSNPVRQSLYTFNDCIGSKTLKCHQAAEALKQINPNMTTQGLEYMIPMPDHPNTVSSPSSKADFENFQKLFKEHDMVYMLTDTRESRWLPTVMGKAHGLVTVNSALGFDSLVVMKHGTEADGQACYFCQDVVAPADSTTNRTLDQQCTVSRPGLSYLASGLAVELGMANVTDTLGAERPQQLRYFLNNFQQISVKNMKAFDQCTACSQLIIDRYRSEGFEFVKSICSGMEDLEDISGLTKLHESTKDFDIISDCSFDTE